MRTRSPARGLFDEGDALARMGDACEPFPQLSQFGCRQRYRHQHAKHFAEGQAAHRHLS